MALKNSSSLTHQLSGIFSAPAIPPADPRLAELKGAEKMCLIKLNFYKGLPQEESRYMASPGSIDRSLSPEYMAVGSQQAGTSPSNKKRSLGNFYHGQINGGHSLGILEIIC